MPYVRIEHDRYFTRDQRCLAVLAEHFPFEGLHVLEPAAGEGDMVRQLQALGARVTAFDVIPYPGIPGIDFMAYTPPAWASYDALVTNPPYALADRFIARALALYPTAWVFVMLRIQWISTPGTRAAGLRKQLTTHPHYAGMLPMRFRPKFFGAGGGITGFAWFGWAPYPTERLWP